MAFTCAPKEVKLRWTRSEVQKDVYRKQQGRGSHLCQPFGHHFKPVYEFLMMNIYLGFLFFEAISLTSIASLASSRLLRIKDSIVRDDVLISVRSRGFP